MKAKPTNWREMLKLAKIMFESGKRQTDLREKFGDVRGQKLFYLLVLNQAFPGVKLFDLTDKEIMQLHFTKLIRLGNRSCSDSLARIQREDATAGRELTQPLTEKEFSNWIDEQLERPQRPDRNIVVPHENESSDSFEKRRNKPNYAGKAMKLFKLSSDKMPTMYIKMPNRDAALLLFEDGFSTESFYETINEPSFRCEEIAPDVFVKELPTEFMIETDCSF